MQEISKKDTKTKGNIAELAAILQATKRGIAVSVPYGNSSPYDMVFDLGNMLAKIQVKSAWLNHKDRNWHFNARRTLVNRKETKFRFYQKGDFDFAFIYVDVLDKFWVIPFDVFSSIKGGGIITVEENRQRVGKTAPFKEAWYLLDEWSFKNGDVTYDIHKLMKEFNDKLSYPNKHFGKTNERECDFCGDKFKPTRPRQKFCTSTCSNKYYVSGRGSKSPPKEYLAMLVDKYPVAKIVDILGVCDKTVRTWCKKEGLIIRPPQKIQYIF